MSGLLAFGIALALSISITPVVIRGLRRGDVYDVPSERSSHERPTPRGGGIATALAALLALGLAWDGATGPAVGLAFTATGFGIVGLLDDFYNLSANLRLAVQVILGSAGAFLLMRGADVSPVALVLISALIVVWLMSFVNAFNFMDGINGISVAQSAVAGFAWAVLGATAGEHFLVVAGLAQAGAAIGFAPYNIPRARVFLGDVGSYFLGGWMGSLVVLGLRAGLPPEAVIAPLALYLLDTGSTLLWRLRAGEEWKQPHRHHVYQRLTDNGWSHVRTVVFATGIIALCAVLGGLAVGGSLWGRLIADVGLVMAVVAYLDWPDEARSPSQPSSPNSSSAPAGLGRHDD